MAVGINVRPGFRGKLQMQLSGASLLTLSVRTMQIRESIDNHDTSGTENPTTADPAGALLMSTTEIQGKKRCRLSVGAQYSAGGTGDPPQFGSNKLYGNIGIIAQAGDTISLDGGTSNPASFMAEDYANTLNVDGTIDYDLSMLSNGPYVRSTVAIGA